MLVVALVLASVVADRPGAGGGEWVMAFVAIAFLAVPPIASTTRGANFERQRWAESDHPFSGGWSNDDDSDDSDDDSE
jgi:hypothetical protein